jgi:hypothetical protein
MALRRKKDEDYPEESQSGLVVAIETFATDLPSSGEPVVVRRGETFSADHELPKALPIWFCPEGVSTWEREAILQRRLSKLGHPGR